MKLTMLEYGGKEVNLHLKSDGFTNEKVARKFLQIIGKPPGQIKIVFIPIAARTDDELEHVQESKNELLEMGILEQNIKVLETPIDLKEIVEFDAIYVGGGNTFYLLKKIKEMGFDKLIRRFVALGKLYVGVSAGSMIAGPDIEIASPFDENGCQFIGPYSTESDRYRCFSPL